MQDPQASATGALCRREAEMIFAVIMAGGSGTRMGGELPKQFLPLCGKPVVIYTLEKFLKCGKIDEYYIGINPGWKELMEELLAEHVPDSAKKIHIVCGGGDRNATLYNVIKAIEADFGVSKEHYIITHDAVRPFVTQQMIEENIELVKISGAVDTVVPAKDTIIESEDGVTVSAIPDRKRMYQSQTPQSFNLSLLKEAYLSLSEDEKAVLTDACRICVMRNIPVTLAKGSDMNIKITTPGDLIIAQAIADEA